MPPRRKKPPASLPPLNRPFVAIDFETADHGADSGCGGAGPRRRLEDRSPRNGPDPPPRERIVFTYIHGITWHGEGRPRSRTRGRRWRRCSTARTSSPRTTHPSTAACCRRAARPRVSRCPHFLFICTVQLARRRWAMKPANLPAVCRRLGIGLIHHNAGSDAEACARIIIAAAAAESAEPHPSNSVVSETHPRD